MSALYLDGVKMGDY